jgi:hypothetical protein
VKEEVLRFAEWNVLPENRDYYYHHFRDNCATRIRDILDRATGGQFRAAYGEAPGRFTLRQHVRRHTWAHPFADWILNFWMGQDIDRPIRVWDEMFLPSEIGMRAEELVYVDGEGRERPLVISVEQVNRAKGRPPVLEAPRRQWPWELGLGILLAGLFGGAWYLERKKSRLGRMVLGLGQSGLGLFFGVVGLLLLFMMTLTNHDYTYNNSNILYINPLLLAALPLGLTLAWTRDGRKRERARLFLKVLWTYVFLGGILTMVIKLFPGFWQQNQVTQALVLPFSAALVWICSKRGRGQVQHNFAFKKGFPP